jgi:transposase
LLFPAPTAASQSDRRPAPDWAYVEKELRRRSVTRLLLWEEYRAANPDGFGYTWFCTTFEAWKHARACVRPTSVEWIGVHTNLFRYLGGVPKFVVCDNLKAAVTNPDRYDPGINRT